MKIKHLKLLTVFLVFAIMLCTPVFADVESAYSNFEAVIDDADILTSEEEEALTQTAHEIAQEYEIAVYIITVQDYKAYSNETDIYYYATYLYSENNLGYGEGEDGVMLVLSMAERDYAYISYGDKAERIFTNTTKIEVETSMLEAFSNNYWYDGFRFFLRDTEFEIKYEWFFDSFPIFIIAIFSFIIAKIIADGQKKKLKSVFVNNSASSYIPNGGVVFRVKDDVFTHTTTSRVKISTQSSGGGGGGRSHSGGGFSGRSGKF